MSVAISGDSIKPDESKDVEPKPIPIGDGAVEKSVVEEDERFVDIINISDDPVAGGINACQECDNIAAKHAGKKVCNF